MADIPIYGSSSTALQAASVDPWTLPRAKKHVAGMFFTLPSARPPSSSLISYQKEKPHRMVWFSFWCKYPNFEMPRPPGVVFSVKGGRFFCKGGVLRPRGGRLLLCQLTHRTVPCVLDGECIIALEIKQLLFLCVKFFLCDYTIV